ncbi:deoxyribose-phosphate aldolase [Enterococcus mediterraneensis]|uniref:deoxyribose-phosphate aldolase n=1 Tax=Enterococcus mediterraneensis TaxID=2364791 RepID=UPI000F04D03F|nr:deoxyribose-phosphate aldolase [Enterococcus mediterraneensis]
MFLREIISLRLLDPTLTDWDFKDLLLTLPEQKIKEIVVLPSYLRRAKQLLSLTDIKIGTVIDYPLGAGTLGKKAFEVGQAFQDGADFLELTVNAETLLGSEITELESSLGSLALAWGEIRLKINTGDMKELTKIESAERIKKLGWKRVVLDGIKTSEAALHDAEIFEYDGGKQLAVQINLQSADPETIKELSAQGVDYFGLSSLKTVDLTLAVNS